MRLLVVNVPSQTEEGYDRGEIVAAKPDSWEWGKQEDPRTRDRTPAGRFCCVDVADGPPGLIRFLSRADFGQSVGVRSDEIWRKSVGRLDLSTLFDGHDLSEPRAVTWQEFRRHLIRGGGLAGGD